MKETKLSSAVHKDERKQSRNKKDRIIALLISAILVFTMLLPQNLAIASAEETAITGLKTNDVLNPLGVDSANPRFSWIMESNITGQKQTAYQLTVATNSSFTDVVWDSGKQEDDTSIEIVYAGAVLNPYTVYYWRVAVWDKDGTKVQSETATFETGMMKSGFDKASWIIKGGVFSSPAGFNLTGANWIWSTDSNASETNYFRYLFTTDTEKTVENAYLLFGADNYAEMYLNEMLITATATNDNSGEVWRIGHMVYLTNLIKNGENVIAAKVWGGGRNGLVCKLLIQYTDGSSETRVSNSGWFATKEAQTGTDYTKFSYNHSAWVAPGSVISYGSAPWQSNVSIPIAAKDPAATQDNPPNGVEGALIVRKNFTLNKAPADVARARIYATAAGLYDLSFNGVKAGDEFLAPGSTQYNLHLMYQTYDVTDKVKSGENTISAVLGKGWYMGRIGGTANIGAQPGFIGKMVITYKDGSTQTVDTDNTWEYTVDGPITANDIYSGETYDATRIPVIYNKVAITTAAMLKIGEIASQISGSVKEMDVKYPVGEPTQPEPGKYIYDFGQNFAGVVEITVKNPIKGTKITMRHGEILNPSDTVGDGKKGTLYTKNLTTAAATDYYTCNGDATETYRPTFTYHGFRYVEISGITPENIVSVKAIVTYTEMEDTGTFETSNSLVNQLWSNTYWSQRSNFLSVPTDCPQRAERWGYSGDAQVFVGTSAYNMDTKTFFDQYLVSLNDGQYNNGAYPGYAPGDQVPSANDIVRNGWGDAGIIIPYTMYARYGDISAVKKYYNNMVKFIEYLAADVTPEHLRKPQALYGDWLALDKSSTPIQLTDTAFCAYSCRLMSEMATLLGKDDDAARFAKYSKDFKDAFNKAYVLEDGKLKYETQTAYTIGLAFDVIAADKKAAAAGHLADAIKTKYNGKISTGFISSGYILSVLCDYGHEDVAFSLLEEEMYPSWLYPITLGATTIPERWDSYSDAEISNPTMNSFNHYSFGAVMEWAYSGLLGIKCDPSSPAFKHFILQPHYGGSITSASGSYISKYGQIESAWKIDDSRFDYACSVPANTTATLYLPIIGTSEIMVNGVPMNEAEGVEVVGRTTQNGKSVVELKLLSGSFKFSSAARATFKLADPSVTEYEADAAFDVIVTTGGDTAKVKIVNEMGNTIGKKSEVITKNADGTKTWRIRIAVGTPGERTLSAMVMDQTGEYKDVDAALEVKIVPPAPLLTDDIISATSVAAGGVNTPFTVTVKTSTAVNKVKIVGETGGTIGTLESSKVDVDGVRTWTISIKVGSKGSRTLTALGAAASGGYGTEGKSFHITIG